MYERHNVWWLEETASPYYQGVQRWDNERLEEDCWITVFFFLPIKMYIKEHEFGEGQRRKSVCVGGALSNGNMTATGHHA